jgi:SAM-dependent methyltransferase
MRSTTPLSLKQQRDFSRGQHHRRRWDTRRAFIRSAAVRSFCGLLSLKRSGIGRLNGFLKGALAPVLDLGAGNGAYAYWLLGGNPAATVVALDWSAEALRECPAPPRGKIMRVCGDAHLLPFRSRAFSGAYSIDTLGHLADFHKVLDELLRVTAPSATVFLHSECSDYRRRWPDRRLIAATGKDLGAEIDGHFFLRTTNELYQAYSRRFAVQHFYSPAGLLGWALGYPEKYLVMYRAAGWRVLAVLCALLAAVKKTPGLGIALRLINSLSNRIELFLGLSGGGSCFAFLKK